MAAPTAALHRATTRIPIVTYGVSNPVSLGLAQSLRAPGKNVTGLSFGLEEAAVLQLGLLRLLRPRLKRVVFMMPANDVSGNLYGDSRRHAPEHVSAAAAAGLELDVAPVRSLGDCERTLATIRDPLQEAAWVVDSSVTTAKQVAALAIRHKVATHGRGSMAVKDGLLVSCWLTISEPHRRVANLIDKVLRGADPGTIPFEQPDKSLIALNRATATAIGITIPQGGRANGRRKCSASAAVPKAPRDTAPAGPP
jgi:putative ABC transport system substrate-binding protein